MREREILKALGRREPYKDIAQRLGVAVGTIDSYRKRALRKLGASDVRDALVRDRRARRHAA